MDDHQKQVLIHNIVSGEYCMEIDGQIYLYVEVPFKVICHANLLYQCILAKYKHDGWLTDKEILAALIRSNQWTNESDSNLKEIAKRIEDLKVQLYQKRFQHDAEDIRKTLRKVEDKEQEMVEVRHSLDYLKLQGFAAYIRTQHILINAICDMDRRPLFSNIEDADPYLMEMALYCRQEQQISAGEMRELARTSPWRAMWATSNHNPFLCSIVHLSDDQKLLLNYSVMYDSVYENTECPDSEVIQDDDMLDGWMISQRRKFDKERSTKEIEQKLPQHNRHSEIFIPVRTKEQAEKVLSLNTAEGTVISKQRQAVLKQAGTLREDQLPDVKRDIQMKVVQQRRRT